MNEADKVLLFKHGWTVECESPFEIRNIDGSFASGQAAAYVLTGLLDEEEEIRKVKQGEITYAVSQLRKILKQHEYHYQGESLERILHNVAHSRFSGGNE